MSNINTQTSTSIATVAEKAQKALLKQAAENKKVLEDILNTSTALELLIEDVQIQENKLNSIAESTKNAVREAAIELDFAIRENENKVLSNLMIKYGYAAITEAQMLSLQSALASAQSVNADDIAKAVEAKTSSIYAGHNAQMAALKAAQAVEIANTTAELKAAQMQNNFMAQQVEDLRSQVEADRAARIEIAKAESGRQGVVVNTNGK